MRTTVRLDKELMRRAKERAAREQRTLTSLIADGLSLILTKSEESPVQEHIELPISQAKGGVLPGVDLNSSRDIFDIIDPK